MMKIVLIMTSILFVASCKPKDLPGKCQSDEAFYTVPYDMESCPADIQAWMDRAYGCGHFAGEEAYDEERRLYIATQMKDLSCNTVGCDYKKLFAKYEGDIVYTGVLSGFAEKVFGSLDALPICLKDGE